MTEVTLLLDARAELGESPTWHADSGALYWIDVRAPLLHRLDANNQAARWSLPDEIGAFALCRGGGAAVVALRTGLFRLDLGTGRADPLAGAPFDPDQFRFNEGICDAGGRFWIGTMHDPRSGRRSTDRCAPMHRFVPGEGLVAASPSTDLHNGFAWAPDGRRFFWSHSSEGAIYRAGYDPGSGRIGDPVLFARTDGSDGVPDGAAMDEEGCYWCAMNGAGTLRRYGPDGTLLFEQPLPASRPSMCSFIGASLDRLVVTTAREGLSTWRRLREPHAGGLFVLRPGVRGVPKPCEVDC